MTNSFPWRVSVIRAVQLAAALAILLSPTGGWTQSADQATFTPAIQQKVDARSVPAKVTSDDESALTSKGYVRIGTIRAEQPGKKANAAETEQLESAILKKAAEAGGDVVRFSKEGAFETADVPTGKSKMKGGTCDQYSTQSVSTTTSSQSCYTDVHGFAHCTTWNTPGFSTRSTCVHRSGGYEVPITKREKSLVSEGTVWRYAPNWTADMARAAEAARETARTTAGADAVSLQARGGINATGNDGYTALIRAIRNVKLEDAEALLDHGADVNIPASEPAHDKGWSPLLEASIFLPGLMKSLVERGASVNATDSGGNTALFWAACGKDQEILKLMLAKGANVNMKDSIDQTPLIHAASCAAPENVKLLLASGADKYLKEYDGKTAADVAQEEMGKAKNSEDRAKYQQILQLLRQDAGAKAKAGEPTTTGTPSLESLTKLATQGLAKEMKQKTDGAMDDLKVIAGIPLDKPNATVATSAASAPLLPSKEAVESLHRAIVNGDHAGAESLLARDADINARDTKGGTLLHYAVGEGYRDVAELLLSHGADVDAKEEIGQTSLHIAASVGNMNMAELLLAHGADVNAKDNVGSTPLYLAAYLKHHDMVELLRRHGGHK
jgi:ankyrin repeat protein